MVLYTFQLLYMHNTNIFTHYAPIDFAFYVLLVYN